MADSYEAYRDCILCPRQCHVDRVSGDRGYCRMGADLLAARAALHYWEEPCLSGTRGSGAVFFSGCSLRCAYCQNYDIAQEGFGKTIGIGELAEIFLKLQSQGAANINLVTAAHFAPSIALAIAKAKEEGLTIPVVYNSSGYESLKTLDLLDGLIDIYLPDYKYADPELARKLSNAGDYPQIALKAISSMLGQTGECVYDEDGYLKRGTIIRHLVLPGHTKNAVEAISLLFQHFGNLPAYSIMNQYTPLGHLPAKLQGSFPELSRTLTRREYEKVVDAALSLGIENGFVQEGKTAKESFIPSFSLEGLIQEPEDGPICPSEPMPGSPLPVRKNHSPTLKKEK